VTRKRVGLIVAAIVGWIAVTAVLQLLRVSDGVPAWRTIWAEDGTFFLPRALEHPVTSLYVTHAGYYQLISRLIAVPAAVLPVGWASAVLAVGGALSASLLSVYVYWASGSVFRTQWARVLMAVLMLFTPVAVSEVSVNGVDAHWYLLFAAFWTLWPSEDRGSAGRWRLVADAVVLGGAALSTPLSVFFAPLVVRRFLRDPNPYRWVVPVAFGVGAFAQALHVLIHPFNSQITPVVVSNIPHFFVLRVLGGMLIGNDYLRAAWIDVSSALEVLLVLVVGAVIGVGLFACESRRFFIGAAAFYAGLLTVVALFTRGSGVPIAHGALDLANVRYTFVPILLLSAAFLAVAESTEVPIAVRVIPVVLLIGAAIANASGPRFDREKGPGWDKAVAAARVQCHAGKEAVDVPVTPKGWTARVRCDRLLGG